MRIRKATLKNAQAILRLINQSNNLMGNDNERYGLENIKNYLSNKLNRIFVCELDDKIVGVFIAQFWKDYVYFHSLAVDKRYYGEGIGKSLINFLENLARKSKKYLIEVETEENNKKMKHILTKLNYKRGKRFQFYSKKI